MDRELEEMLAEADKELETMLNDPELNKELNAMFKILDEEIKATVGEKSSNVTP